MATRIIFIPIPKFPYVDEVSIPFEWHSGFSKSQAQKSIDSLHNAARQQGLSPVLEISSKSRQLLGISLSAFNLQLQLTKERQVSVECAYQGSKIFEFGGPYIDLYEKSSRDAIR